MDAAVELGRNLVSRHQIQPEYEDEQADAWRGGWTRLARPISQARTGTGEYSFSLFTWPRSGLATLPGWSILCYMGWPYRHTYCPLFVLRGVFSSLCCLSSIGTLYCREVPTIIIVFALYQVKYQQYIAGEKKKGNHEENSTIGAKTPNSRKDKKSPSEIDRNRNRRKRGIRQANTPIPTCYKRRNEDQVHKNWLYRHVWQKGY